MQFSLSFVFIHIQGYTFILTSFFPATASLGELPVTSMFSKSWFLARAFMIPPILC